MPSLFNDSHCAAKTLTLICKEAAEMQSDSSGWVDGWGTERETVALLWETTFLSSSQYEAARASRLQGL